MTAPLVVAGTALLLFGSGEEARAARRFTVRDSIEMHVFSDEGSDAGNPVHYAPDGTAFFVVTRRGLLTTDEVESTIWLFEAREMQAALSDAPQRRTLAPTPIARIACSSNEEPISAARWSADGRAIEFLGRTREFERQLFVVDVHSGATRRFSPGGQDVKAFDRTREVAVFAAQAALDPSDIYQSGGPQLPDVQEGPGLSVIDLLYPNWSGATFGDRAQLLWRAVGNEPPAVVRDSSGNTVTIQIGRSHLSILALSPSGRYVVGTASVKRVPPEWEAYEPKNRLPAYRFTATRADVAAGGPEKEMRPTQYVLVDLQTGQIAPLIDAPFGFDLGYYEAPRASWSPDERYVAVVNTLMPAREARLHPCVAVVDVLSRRAECVLESISHDVEQRLDVPRVTRLEWLGEGRALQIDFAHENGTDAPSRTFRHTSGASRWVQSALPGARARTGLRATLKQSVNDQPVLIVSNARNPARSAEWNPNPQLADIEWGEATVYRWHDSTGHEWRGGLVKPPDYARDRTYPLVIQTHGFNPTQFLVDGYAPTANAARAMAARGIVVLQVEELRTSAQDTPREPHENGLAGYEAAILQLAREGIVDPERVGIIGFSHTGWTVMHSLIHAPRYFRAATMAEADDFSFYEYLFNADYQYAGRAQYYANGIGSVPFGAGLARWVADSPGFNLDRIRAPVLFQQNSPVALAYAWDLYAALRLQQKPVELLYFRNGAHVLVKPRQRLLSQEMNVDWYDFWLNHHEDPDPAKAAQYVRWRAMAQKMPRPSSAK
jgi:dipeptidyl aminopeptidase/acylaminoacyl peptidase